MCDFVDLEGHYLEFLFTGLFFFLSPCCLSVSISHVFLWTFVPPLFVPFVLSRQESRRDTSNENGEGVF